jgi:DNA-binding MurR/RpiR family transcriptional regulator
MSRMQPREALEAGLSRMRPSEADVARRLLRNLGLVASTSLREVAAFCETSDSTVVRACRAAGFDGFQDLKYHVLREFTALNSAQALPDPTPHADYSADISASLGASEPALGAATSILESSNRIVIAAVGASLGVGLILTDVLCTLGRQVLPVRDEQALAFALTPPTRGLALLAISHSGETGFVLRSITDARRAGVPTIGIGNEPASELARQSDVYLPTRILERPEGSFSIAPRISQLAVLDQLVLRLRRPAAPTRSRRTRPSPEPAAA